MSRFEQQLRVLRVKEQMLGEDSIGIVPSLQKVAAFYRAEGQHDEVYMHIRLFLSAFAFDNNSVNPLRMQLSDCSYDWSLIYGAHYWSVSRVDVFTMWQHRQTIARLYGVCRWMQFV